MPTVGKAYVQIIPKTDGNLTGEIEQALGGETIGRNTGMKIAGGIGSALKVGGAAAATLAGATAAITGSVIKGTGAVAEYGDNIDKMSQKMGMSAESYQEWDAVMRHSGTSMEAMKASMKTLANAAESGSDAFEIGFCEVVFHQLIGDLNEFGDVRFVEGVVHFLHILEGDHFENITVFSAGMPLVISSSPTDPVFSGPAHVFVGVDLQRLAHRLGYNFEYDLDAALAGYIGRFAVFHASADGAGAEQLREGGSVHAAGVHRIVERITQSGLGFTSVDFLVCVGHRSGYPLS